MKRILIIILSFTFSQDFEDLYFGTDNESYPACLSESDVGDQDTTDCAYGGPGDLNGDGNYNVLDVVLLVNCAIGDATCIEQGDMNSDGMWNVLDVVLLVNCVIAGTCEG